MVVLIACLGSVQHAQAVSPAPNGCYPGYTTAEGCNALNFLTIGLGNTGIGSYALFANTIGSYNTAVGAGALDLNGASNNTATGASALLFNTTGNDNTANGVDALAFNNTGIQNTAAGAFALFNNTGGGGNIAIGFQAGSALTTGNDNIEIGNIGVAAESNTIRIGDRTIHAAIFLAGITKTSPAPPNQAVLVDPTTGHLGSVDIGSFGVVSTSPENTAVGDQALSNNTTGGNNTATGAQALQNNTTGNFNDALGAFSLQNNVSGFSNNAFGFDTLFSNIRSAANTAVGDLALEFNDADGAGTANFNTAVGAGALAGDPVGMTMDGDSNNAVGDNALGANSTGSFNQAMGVDALSSNADGAANIAIGDSALIGNAHGSFNTVVGWSAADSLEGSDNIYIGATAGTAVTSENGTIRVGDTSVIGACFIAGISGQTSSGGMAVFIDGNGKLGTSTSSARFKENIQPMDQASESIFALKPVTFRYKKAIDPKHIPHFGLVAEDVEKVNPDLVVRDEEGKPYSVRYDQVNAMLLNEFLKEHRAVQEQGATITELKEQVAALTEGLQKVSAQLDLSKHTPQMVLNNQ